ncbi:hypothetical protein evm_013799 [Chilo suppressalis]|nr:hypothetical protein evm_013799 [Chilo suppressalis]
MRKSAFGQRHVQVVLIFFGLVLAYAMRVNMSLAIVAMTDPHAGGNSCSAEYCKAYVNQTFNWSVGTRSVILSSFFWGYVVLQVPGGELANRVGGKLLLASSIAINSILLMAIPTCAYYGGWQLVVVCRVLQGLFQGVTFPSVHNLLGKWVPVEEKSRLGQFVYAGSQLGTALQLITAGYIADQWGWPMIFYSVGILGAIWTLFYLKLGAASPQSSNTISPDERGYIESSLGTVQVHKKLQTPWKAIMTSKQFLALVLVHCGQNWGFWTLLTEIPSYMELVLKVNIKSNGVMSALPYLAMYLMSFPLGFISDYTLKKKWLSITACRKISNSVGQWGPALALIGLSYAPADATIAVAILTAVVGLNAGHYTGYLLVHIDMSPNFAGTLMGITNCIANTISIIAPLVAGVILTDQTDVTQWRTVFYLSSVIYFVANLIFVVFGTCETQAWNEPESEDTKVSDSTTQKKIEKVV